MRIAGRRVGALVSHANVAQGLRPARKRPPHAHDARGSPRLPPPPWACSVRKCRPVRPHGRAPPWICRNRPRCLGAPLRVPSGIIPARPTRDPRCGRPQTGSRQSNSRFLEAADCSRATSKSTAARRLGQDRVHVALRAILQRRMHKGWGGPALSRPDPRRVRRDLTPDRRARRAEPLAPHAVRGAEEAGDWRPPGAAGATRTSSSPAGGRRPAWRRTGATAAWAGSRGWRPSRRRRRGPRETRCARNGWRRPARAPRPRWRRPSGRRQHRSGTRRMRSRSTAGRRATNRTSPCSSTVVRIACRKNLGSHSK